jgi:hypothetical protein
MEQKRVEGRFLCADLARLDWIAKDDNLRSEQALLEDISSMGGCVQMEEPVAIGSTMMLTVGSTPFYGHVCHCTLRDEGYFVGLSFSNDTIWSAGVVRPQHLLVLQQLGQGSKHDRKPPDASE